MPKTIRDIMPESKKALPMLISAAKAASGNFNREVAFGHAFGSGATVQVAENYDVVEIFFNYESQVWYLEASSGHDTKILPFGTGELSEISHDQIVSKIKEAMNLGFVFW